MSQFSTQLTNGKTCSARLEKIKGENYTNKLKSWLPFENKSFLNEYFSLAP